MPIEITTHDTKSDSLYRSLRALLLDVLDDHRTRVIAGKAAQLYIGYWGRALYFFLGVQAILTAALVMANRMLP